MDAIQKYAETSDILKAMSHPIRLCILRNLAEQQKCGHLPTNVNELQSCLHIPQSTLSQHLQKLRQSSIIIGKKHGLEITYQISDERVFTILDCFFPPEKIN